MPTPPPASPRGRAARAEEPHGSKPLARFRLRITARETIAVGPGKIALLEAIAATGSITGAAKQLDMSYRRAWLLLAELNGAMKKPAVTSANGGLQGGGSVLTAAGRQMIDSYRDAEAKAVAACKPELTRLMALLSR